MTNDRERRAFTFDVRAEENEEHGHFLSGTPIVFDVQTDLGWCRECIAPGALDDADMKDVRFLVGHDTSAIPLARSRNNNANSTMQMSVNDKGMDIRVDLDTENNGRARELYSAAKRQDISGMSFMFSVDSVSWEDLDSDKPLRRITKIRRIYEVSAVAFPAYESTTLEARSDNCEVLDSNHAALESVKAELAEARAAHLAAKAKAEAERENAKARIRILLEANKR